MNPLHRDYRNLLASLLLALSLCSHAAVGVSVKPRRAPVTLKQTQQFIAMVSNTSNTAVTWLVDGVAGGTATSGKISAAGLYTPPSAAGTHTVTARSAADSTRTASATVWVTAYPGMWTHHGDQYRSGLNLQELALSPANVSAATFGKLFSRPVDGQMYAQPLHVSSLLIGGVYRNVVYVATQHDSVYAFDADGKTSAPLWRRSFINPAAGITTLPKPANALIAPEIGITSTPVIDRGTSTLYVLAATRENGTIVHRLHALSLTSGAEKFGGPIRISGSVPGAYAPLAKNGLVSFVSSRHLQRPALLLLGGVVYIAFGSNGDALPYNGWLFAYSALNTGTLHQTGIFCTSPNQGASAIWQSGAGPAADSAGNIYVVTSNGAFNLSSGGRDAGDSFLKLAPPQNGKLALLDYFTPADQATLNANDFDLGSGGPMVAPTQSGAIRPNLVLAGAKSGEVYVINRSNMGKFGNNFVQRLVLGSDARGLYSTPANWNGFVYFGPQNDNLLAYHFSGGLLSFWARSSNCFAYPGPTPMVSARGNTNGIVWALDTGAYAGGTPEGAVNASGQAVLHAYNATTLAELYNSKQAGTRDLLGVAIKYTSPTIANGRVYVGTANQLSVFGFLP